jgi:hypothetical protein
MQKIFRKLDPKNMVFIHLLKETEEEGEIQDDLQGQRTNYVK